jgi:RND family efflux transporter MFP subunit
VEILDEEAVARRRRRIVIAAIVGLLVVLVALFFVVGSRKPAPAAAGASTSGKPPGAAPDAQPSVTVIVPGRQQVARTITSTGNLGAKRDMPVGISGEGGRVLRVLVDRGQWVSAGQVLAVIDRSVQSQQAQQLVAQVDAAKADANIAQSNLDRAQALVSRGFISKADVEQKRATRDADLARVRVAQAQLGEVRARIGQLDVRAPTAGLVLDRAVEAGQVVGPGSGALFRIAEGGQMEVRARLSQEDMQRVSVGGRATVTPVGSSLPIVGAIWQVSPIIDLANRQGEARIAVPYSPLMRPGGFASIAITAGSADAPLLPNSAVLNDDSGNYVYIVDAHNKIARRNVKIATVTNKGVVIGDGLAGNERVVLSAGAFLNPGDKVIPRREAVR